MQDYFGNEPISGNRQLTIQDEHSKSVFYYDGKNVKDSEALHYMLCEVDPGEDYKVSFSNI